MSRWGRLAQALAKAAIEFALLLAMALLVVVALSGAVGEEVSPLWAVVGALTVYMGVLATRLAL